MTSLGLESLIDPVAVHHVPELLPAGVDEHVFEVVEFDAFEEGVLGVDALEGAPEVGVLELELLELEDEVLDEVVPVPCVLKFGALVGVIDKEAVEVDDDDGGVAEVTADKDPDPVVPMAGVLAAIAAGVTVLTAPAMGALVPVAAVPSVTPATCPSGLAASTSFVVVSTKR
ncbi:hypothetical protein FRB98_008618 [Tulasnella sp. 332]|nr:hypothetical protein FRB98_008618 [Tulasnella sp. 332]